MVRDWHGDDVMGKDEHGEGGDDGDDTTVNLRCLFLFLFEGVENEEVDLDEDRDEYPELPDSSAWVAQCVRSSVVTNSKNRTNTKYRIYSDFENALNTEYRIYSVPENSSNTNTE